MPSTHTIEDLCRAAESLWPNALAEEWDRVGLVSGQAGAPLRKVLLAVDAVEATVTEALEWGADALLTHHPLLLRGIHSVAEDTAKGSLLARLIRGGCALYTAHTNADQPEEGVSDVIARRLELRDTRPIVPATDEAIGLGRVGSLPQSVRLREFAEQLATILPQTVSGARAAGDPNREVRRVAVLGGAGDSLLDHPLVRAADVYVTSDLRHHPVQEALELAAVAGGPAFIDVSHWASESLWLEGAGEQLTALLPGVECRVSTRRTDPWTFSVGAE